MATSNRALTSALRRTTTSSRLVAQATATSSCCSYARLSAVAATRQAWRPTAVYRISSPWTAAGRWYSTGEGQPLVRNWEFAEIEKQVKLNAELKDGADAKVIFVDVREPHELHQTGKIPGAINIPITTAVQSFHISDEDFEDLYGFARPAKDAPLVFYCKAGVRAKGAAALAQHAGWTDIGDYPGSWNDWELHKGPVEPVKKQG